MHRRMTPWLAAAGIAFAPVVLAQAAAAWLEAHGLEATSTKTLDEFVQDGIKLKQANASTPNFSGIYFPGKYWYAALPFIWENGGDIAVDQDGKWAGKLADDGSVKGLNTIKEIMDKASGAPKDGDESKEYLSFCKNEIAMLMGKPKSRVPEAAE